MSFRTKVGGCVHWRSSRMSRAGSSACPVTKMLTSHDDAHYFGSRCKRFGRCMGHCRTHCRLASQQLKISRILSALSPCGGGRQLLWRRHTEVLPPSILERVDVSACIIASVTLFFTVFTDIYWKHRREHWIRTPPHQSESWTRTLATPETYWTSCCTCVSASVPRSTSASFVAITLVDYNVCVASSHKSPSFVKQRPSCVAIALTLTVAVVT